MPFFDRYWGLRVIIAAVVGAFAILIPIRLLPESLLLDERAGNSALVDGLALCAASIFLAAIAVYVSWSVRRARRRVQRRHDIIRGLERQPKVSRRPSAANLPPHKEQPFVIVWRIDIFTRILSAVLLPILVPSFFVSLVFIYFVVLFVIQPEHDTTLAPHGQLSPFVWIALVLPLGFLIMYLNFLEGLGHSPRIEIGTDGITEQPRFSHAKSLRWEDACLLEITPFPKMNGRTISVAYRYILYGQHDAIRWTDEYTGSKDDYTKREQLLKLVKHYTGLRPMALKRSVWDI